MASTCEDIVCGTDCDLVMPTPKFNICSPEGKFGQVAEIYRTNPGYPLNDENNPNEWLGRMAMPDNNPAKIHRLIVIGDLPASESAEVEMSRNRFIYGPETNTLNARIDEVNQENYEFMRQTHCNVGHLIWYVGNGGDAYGGNAGIKVSGKFKHVIPEGTNDLQTLVASFKWKSDTPPCRFLHPLFGNDTGLES
jgi:hypothetical protein